MRGKDAVLFMHEINKQEFISQLWLDRAKQIHTAEDKFNLTTLMEGKHKHDAEVAYLKASHLIHQETTLLDLACGNGRFFDVFGGTVQWMTGTDLCGDFVEFLNQWKTERHYQNMDFLKLDLLEANFYTRFSRQYSLIFLFGLSQIIIDDDDLAAILMNTKKILAPGGHLLIKQTTSMANDSIHIDHFSQEWQQRWVAHYRTEKNIARLCESVGLKVVKSEPVYTEEKLGEHYKKVERWDNTRQIMFDVVCG